MLAGLTLGDKYYTIKWLTSWSLHISSAITVRWLNIVTLLQLSDGSVQRNISLLKANFLPANKSIAVLYVEPLYNARNFDGCLKGKKGKLQNAVKKFIIYRRFNLHRLVTESSIHWIASHWKTTEFLAFLGSLPIFFFFILPPERSWNSN